MRAMHYNASPRHGEGLIPVWWHPELIIGYLPTPPRRYASITSLNRSIASSESRRTLGTLVMACLATLLFTIVLTHPPDAREVESQQSTRACLQWHTAAGTVAARLIQSTRDADLQQVTDSIHRIRRARQNCEAGLLAQACRDYHAVAAAAPGHVLASQLFPCATCRIPESELRRPRGPSFKS